MDKKKKTFSETYLLTDYGHLRHQNAFWKIKQDKRKGVFGGFFRYLRTKTLNREQNTLYGKQEFYQKNVFLSVFFYLVC